MKYFFLCVTNFCNKVIVFIVSLLNSEEKMSRRILCRHIYKKQQILYENNSFSSFCSIGTWLLDFDSGIMSTKNLASQIFRYVCRTGKQGGDDGRFLAK